ncbi:MAG: hypothetical protein B7Y36_12750 [Novosphingobium sp. 28-62-57]|uniref:hypothetical protein n=1 Tax=unclassified Novosphingobium TaxID=2644732 RepID=UPI000BCFB60C|nr:MULTISPECIES: hypothetical protein [unclassified Novosphingobium]OYW49151.1 MAG: hypothetical protein B7Z34_10180 [Novosphingobium sp. 12-62-10]OYZ09822.1 MAG: hypothetical protein B7Y36_12750 [Novosphingobium sp. 28-62-57]OZA31656.1 MAG: hypothetical protein B7X92_13845 [Novosphingobium sp. 17-62-9]HQS70539.1 hypothetical protein [Novosphingobium sp.]
MAGKVGTTIVIKGKKIRLEQSFGDDDASFQRALEKLTEQSRAMGKAAAADTASKRGSFRKPKRSK